MIDDLSKASDKIDSWMTINKLKNNNDKTEMMPCGTKNKINSITCNSALIGGETIQFSSKVKNLGIFIESY